MLSIPATVGLIMLSMPTILIFSGDSFSEADLTSKIMALRGILVPLNSFIVLHFFIPLKKEKYNLVSTGVAAMLNLIINFVLIPLFAQNGAAVATVLAEFIELIINLFFFSKYIELKQIFNKTWQYIVSAIPIAPVCYLLSLCNMNIALYALLSIALSVIFYFGILLLFKNSLILDGYTLIKTKFFNRIQKH